VLNLHVQIAIGESDTRAMGVERQTDIFAAGRNASL